MSFFPRAPAVAGAVALFLCLPAFGAEAPAKDDDGAPSQAVTGQGHEAVKWTKGPAKVDLGNNLAELTLEESHRFVGSSDARRLLYAMGNQPNGNEVGLVAPTDKKDTWLLVFEYSDVGHVKDDEKDKIDADALLKSITEGTEEANKERQTRNIPALHVIGWKQKPTYDSKTHNFTWALLAKSDDGSDVVNYNIRILSREGYMSVTLADAPENLDASKVAAEKLLSKFSFKSGKTYAEFRQGDKVAQYGLAALVAAGAGAAAVKLGLFAVLGKFLAKAWKLVVVAIAGVGASIKRLFTGGRRGRMSGSDSKSGSGPASGSDS